MSMRSSILGVVATSVLALACSGGGGGGGGGGGYSPTVPPPAPGENEVNVVDSRFDPRQLTVDPGTTVTWIRRGSLSDHTVTANDGSFDSGFTFQSEGDTFQHTFDASTAGQTIAYRCMTHAECCDMRGSIRVRGGS